MLHVSMGAVTMQAGMEDMLRATPLRQRRARPRSRGTFNESEAPSKLNEIIFKDRTRKNETSHCCNDRTLSETNRDDLVAAPPGAMLDAVRLVVALSNRYGYVEASVHGTSPNMPSRAEHAHLRERRHLESLLGISKNWPQSHKGNSGHFATQYPIFFYSNLLTKRSADMPQ